MWRNPENVRFDQFLAALPRTVFVVVSSWVSQFMAVAEPPLPCFKYHETSLSCLFLCWRVEATCECIVHNNPSPYRQVTSLSSTCASSLASCIPAKTSARDHEAGARIVRRCLVCIFPLKFHIGAALAPEETANTLLWPWKVCGLGGKKGDLLPLQSSNSIKRHLICSLTSTIVTTINCTWVTVEVKSQV